MLLTTGMAVDRDRITLRAWRRTLLWCTMCACGRAHCQTIHMGKSMNAATPWQAAAMRPQCTLQPPATHRTCLHHRTLGLQGSRQSKTKTKSNAEGQVGGQRYEGGVLLQRSRQRWCQILAAVGKLIRNRSFPAGGGKICATTDANTDNCLTCSARHAMGLLCTPVHPMQASTTGHSTCCKQLEAIQFVAF